MSSGKEIHGKVTAEADRHAPGEGTGVDSWASTAFKGRYLQRDEYDTIYEIKQKLAEVPAGGATARTWDITDKEAKWHLDKVKQLELLNFHEFLQTTYNIDASDPVKLRWAQEMFPEFWSMREQMIDDNAEIQKRLAKIRLLGPRDKDDFTLLFGIATGRVNVPTGEIYNPAGAQNGGPPARGLFNPLRHVGRRAPDPGRANRLITNRIMSANVDRGAQYRGVGGYTADQALMLAPRFGTLTERNAAPHIQAGSETFEFQK